MFRAHTKKHLVYRKRRRRKKLFSTSVKTEINLTSIIVKQICHRLTLKYVPLLVKVLYRVYSVNIVVWIVNCAVSSFTLHSHKRTLPL